MRLACGRRGKGWLLLLTAATMGCATTPPAEAPVILEFLSSSEHLSLSLPFSEAVRAGDTLYLSGQLGTLPGTVELAEGGVRGEARQALANIGAVLERNGSGLDRVVKCTVFLADMSEWAAFNEVYRDAFGDRLPARSALQAGGLALDARLELECIALAN